MEILQNQGYNEIEVFPKNFVWTFNNTSVEKSYIEDIKSMVDSDIAVILPAAIIEDMFAGKTSMFVCDYIKNIKKSVFLFEAETGLIKGEAYISGSVLLSVDNYENFRWKHNDSRYFSDFKYEPYGYYVESAYRYCSPLDISLTKGDTYFACDKDTLRFHYINKEEIKEEQSSKELTSCIAYIDGSFNVATGVYGSGAVLIDTNGNIITELTSAGRKMANMRNVAGEIAASALAINEAINRNMKELQIFYDYEGVGSWADHRWRTNNEYTKAYADFVDRKRKDINITFVWVKGHSGNAFNEKADALAKKACGV